MEANEQSVTPENIPAMEQDILDTQAINANDTGEWEQAMGLPIRDGSAPEVQDNPIQPPQVQPQIPTQNQVTPTTDNDNVRYEYWQSEAAKLKNQLSEVQQYMPMVDYLRTNPEAVQSITPGGKTPAEAAPTSQEQEEFPPPPAKPEQPQGFSREEAFTDANSASAKYLDSVDRWRDDMQTYGNLSSQYEIATMRESYNKKLDGLEKVEVERNARSQEAQEMSNVRNYVSSNYNLGTNLDDFITTMNDPKSINMDDLVGYYQYKNGTQGNVPAQPMQTASSNFRQIQRAQSVPQPMGVQPAQSNAPSAPGEGFMDAILGSDNKSNIL